MFAKLDERNGDAKSSSELAKMTGADPVLMGASRHFPVLKSFCSLVEVDANHLPRTVVEASRSDGKYLRNGSKRIPSDFFLKLPQRINSSRRLSHYVSVFHLISNRILHSGADHHDRFDHAGPSFFVLPKHLFKLQYKNPDDSSNSAFQLGHGIKDHYFEWMSQHPERSSQFQNHMVGHRIGQPSWMDPNFYPVNENLVNGAKGAKAEDDAVFLVDVGGGKGQVLQDLHRKYPELPGKLVLQDVKGAIEEAKASDLNKKIVPMEHDFFTKQPVIGMFADRTRSHLLMSLGARAYFMRSCLHDWSDPKAHDILTSLKSGLTKGYSKLLINENVIPDQGAHWLSTALDMVMMVNFSSSERTEQNWRALLESAGFRIIKIWTLEPGVESLIEAELA